MMRNRRAAALSSFVQLARPRRLAAAAALTLVAHAAAAPIDAGETMDRVRAALGSDAVRAVPSGVSLTGTARVYGLDAPFSLMFDARGAFVEEVGGRIPGATGCDGATVWRLDWNGVGGTLALGDRDSALMEASIMTNRWASQDGPLTFAAAEDGPGDAVTLTFEMKDSPLRGRVEIDPAASLPRRFEWGGADAHESMSVTDFLTFEGARIPRRAEHIQAGSPQASVYTVESARPAPTFIQSPYAPRATTGRGVRFDKDAPATLETKRAPTGHLLAKASVNGKPAGWFIFDTGAGANCILPAYAKDLGIEPFGSAAVHGGAGVVQSSMHQPETLAVGPITLENPIMVGVDLAFLDGYMGEHIIGVIGYDVIARCVAEIDMAGGRVALHDPDAYTLPPGVAWQDLIIYGRHPCVRGSVEGHEGVFKLDTGAGGASLMMHSPAVTRLNMLEGRATTALPAGAMGGVGGASAGVRGVVKTLSLFGRERTDVPTIFITSTTGALANEYTLGNVGGGLWQPDVMVVDYPHARIAFVPPATQKQPE